MHRENKGVTLLLAVTNRAGSRETQTTSVSEAGTQTVFYVAEIHTMLEKAEQLFFSFSRKMDSQKFDAGRHNSESKKKLNQTKTKTS